MDTLNTAGPQPLPIKLWFLQLANRYLIGISSGNDPATCYFGDDPAINVSLDDKNARFWPLAELPPPPPDCKDLAFQVAQTSAVVEHTQFGISINDMCIEEPTLSECGRFNVDPQQAYGLTPNQVKYLEALNYQAHVVSMKLDPDDYPDMHMMQSIHHAFTQAIERLGIHTKPDEPSPRERA